MSTTKTTTTDPADSTWTSDDRLAIRLEIDPKTTFDRIPMRSAQLHFRNKSDTQLRIFMPVPDAFRANISTLFFTPTAGDPLFVPTPRPHGYMVSEKDFVLLEAHEERTIAQSFTIDPMTPGPGTATARTPGFARGAAVKVRWILENTLTTFPGGVVTFDGPTKALFGGQPVPGLWTGKLTTVITWVVPD